MAQKVKIFQEVCQVGHSQEFSIAYYQQALSTDAERVSPVSLSESGQEASLTVHQQEVSTEAETAPSLSKVVFHQR